MNYRFKLLKLFVKGLILWKCGKMSKPEDAEFNYRVEVLEIDLITCDLLYQSKSNISISL